MGNNLVLGFFDGVHVAHRKVIQSVDSPIVVTFSESPAKYFGLACEYILQRNDSLAKINSLGVKDLLVLNFADICKMSATQYLDFLISKFSPDNIVTGFNHTFGYNKQGNQEFLFHNQDKYGYKYICVQKQIFNGETVSSSLIRDYLRNGNVVYANQLLESKFTLQGEVIKGAGVGHKIGFPTANVMYPIELVRIPFGVYKVNVFNMTAIMNWGVKPTLCSHNEPILEIHIPNYNNNLYGKVLRIEVLDKIRDEMCFTSLSDLKTQIQKDIQECLK